MNKQEYVAALRELADFVESKDFPDTWQGWYGESSFDVPSLTFHSANKKQFGEFASIVGKFKKSGDQISTDITSVLSKGAIIHVWGKKEVVCERVVIGTRTVPATEEKIIPAEPEHEEEIIEWRCPPSFVALKEEN